MGICEYEAEEGVQYGVGRLWGGVGVQWVGCGRGGTGVGAVWLERWPVFVQSVCGRMGVGCGGCWCGVDGVGMWGRFGAAPIFQGSNDNDLASQYFRDNWLRDLCRARTSFIFLLASLAKISLKLWSSK